MTMNGFTNKVRLAAAAAGLAASALLLPGCYDDDYFNHRDTVSLGAGDAVAVNQVTHTVDPWPAYSKDTDIHLQGERARVAVERYQQNKSIPPHGLNTTEITGQAGPGAQAAAQVKN
jgi:hypothetical protein